MNYLVVCILHFCLFGEQCSPHILSKFLVVLCPKDCVNF